MARPEDRPAPAGTLKPERVQEKAAEPAGEEPEPERVQRQPAEPPEEALKPERVQ